jgi:hypothetical protein
MILHPSDEVESIYYVVLPLLIFVVCFGGGAAAAAAWLPDLDAGPVGTFAFYLVCGLLGAALGLAGLNIYSTVDNLHHLSRDSGGVFGGEGQLLAAGIRDLLFQSGSIAGLAALVYLFAPTATGALNV